MKTLVIAILFMVAGMAQGQQMKTVEWLDSINSTRTAISVDLKGFPYVSLTFQGLTTSDTMFVYNLLDSVPGYQNSKFTRDTSTLYLLNLATNAQVTGSTGGKIMGLASPLSVEIVNKFLNKVFIKNTDATVGTIYIRFRGVIW